MEYRRKLLEFRAKHRLTQKELSEIMDVGVVMIHRYESGISKPSKVHEIIFEEKMKEWEKKKNV